MGDALGLDSGERGRSWSPESCPWAGSFFFSSFSPICWLLICWLAEFVPDWLDDVSVFFSTHLHPLHCLRVTIALWSLNFALSVQ